MPAGATPTVAATLRAALPADLDAICALEAAGFDHARWSRESWAAELNGRDRYVVVASGGGAVEGVATFSIQDDVAELLRVVVDPVRRGRGLGGELVAAGVAWARANGARRMLLEVEETNAPARALYDRAGFVVIARRQNYYGTGHHALVMEKELSHE